MMIIKKTLGHPYMLFTSLLFIFINPASAEINAEVEEPTSLELELRVKPSLCLTYSSEEDCSLTVEVIWNNSKASNLCLFNVQEETPIECWENTQNATLTEERIMNEDLVYWLSPPGENTPLVTAKVEMASIVEDERRHRSRRHIWNLI